MVTGASRGIGAEYARALAGQGYDLLLVGRDKARLETLRQELLHMSQREIWMESLDLSQPRAAQTLYDLARSYRSEVSLFINNAGFGRYGDFVDMPMGSIHNMLQLHINTIVESIRLFLPDMLARQHGDIITVASVAGFFPIPYMTEYAATKAFLIAFSEGLARETQDQGVTIQVCCPGFTDTDFHQTARHQPKHVFFAQSPQLVVQTSLQALKSKRTLVTIGWQGRLALWISKIIPHRILMTIAGKAVRQPRTPHLKE
ncbi:MAG: SDR family oxidoreductase [Nitrospirota bacterium]|nr:SDR family oxidoreductase [Nitrospirota bacterium]